VIGFALGAPPAPTINNQKKLTVAMRAADGVTGIPLVGATVEAEVVNASGFPQLANDPVAPAGAPKILDMNPSGPNGWVTLDVTYSGQGIQYPIMVNLLSADGSRMGCTGPVVGS